MSGRLVPTRGFARLLASGCLALALALSPGALAADADLALEPAAELPAALPDSLKAAVSSPGHRVSRDGKVLAELWLRQAAPPAGGVNEGALSVEYGALGDSALVGVIHFPASWIDYRETEVQPGVYAMRYWVQPADGDHMGVSQYRDFLVLTPVGEDADPDASYDQERLEALSEKVSGKVHPAVIALFPVAEEPAGGAALTSNDLGQPMLAVKGPDRNYGFVLEGHGDLP
jgi:hypothetical protein